MEILNTMETTKLLAINFESTEVANVLDQHFVTPFSTKVTVSNNNESLAVDIVDANHQIKAQYQFKLQEMGSVSKNISHVLFEHLINPTFEHLINPTSLKVSTASVMILRLGSDRKIFGHHQNLFYMGFPHFIIFGTKRLHWRLKCLGEVIFGWKPG